MTTRHFESYFDRLVALEAEESPLTVPEIERKLESWTTHVMLNVDGRLFLRGHERRMAFSNGLYRPATIVPDELEQCIINEAWWMYSDEMAGISPVLSRETVEDLQDEMRICMPNVEPDPHACAM